MATTGTPPSRAANQAAAVADSSRGREVRDLLVVESRLDFDLVRQAAQASSQDHARVGSGVPSLPDRGDGFLDLSVEF